MSTELFAIYVSTVVLLCLTPGPNSLLAITNALRYGLNGAVYSTLGCATGLVTLIGICLSGLGLVLAASEPIFVFIKWVGVAYLIYLGITLFLSRHSPIESLQSLSRSQSIPKWRLFRQGFLVVATNPKVLLFFSAFLPQFYVPSSSFWAQFLLLAGTFAVIEIALEFTLAFGADRIARLTQSQRRMKFFSRVTGGLFIAAGVALMTLERPR